MVTTTPPPLDPRVYVPQPGDLMTFETTPEQTTRWTLLTHRPNAFTSETTTRNKPGIKLLICEPHWATMLRGVAQDGVLFKDLDVMG